MKFLFRVLTFLMLTGALAGLIVAMIFIVPMITVFFYVVGLIVAAVVLVFFIRILINFSLFIWQLPKGKNKPTGESN